MMKAFKLGSIVLLIIFFNNGLLTAQLPVVEAMQTALLDSDYVICVDGGGSKTELQILDCHGDLVELKQNDTSTYSIKAEGSNINVVGKDGVKSVLDALISNLKIRKSNLDLNLVALRCAVIGGFSGAGRIESQNSITELFKGYGFDEKKIVITSDASMALEALDGDGIILISGTGSICFGKKGTETIRVGGLGRFIGDEGSGYWVGIRALNAALEDEYGWGQATTLKKALRDYFKTTDLKTIVAPFYKNEITNYQIAAISPIVFEEAKNNDPVALKIKNKAAKELGKMLSGMIKNGKFLDCPIYLFGGIFKNKDASQFIQVILKEAGIEDWKIFNKSEDNATVLAVQRLQKQI